MMPWAVFLLRQTEQLVDVYARASAYGRSKGVEREDVLALMMEAFGTNAVKADIAE
jgi:hypothetical protein